MAFRIRDLMIDVMPQGSIDEQFNPNRLTVPIYTCHASRILCWIFTCPWLTHNPVPAHLLEPSTQRIAALKEQLRTALAEVEAQERAAEEASRPRTREEAEELEEKLKGALEEVRGWKETLSDEGSK